MWLEGDDGVPPPGPPRDLPQGRCSGRARGGQVNATFAGYSVLWFRMSVELTSWNGGLTQAHGPGGCTPSCETSPHSGCGSGGAVAFLSCLRKTVRRIAPLVLGRDPKSSSQQQPPDAQRTPAPLGATVRATQDGRTSGLRGRPTVQLTCVWTVPPAVVPRSPQLYRNPRRLLGANRLKAEAPLSHAGV